MARFKKLCLGNSTASLPCFQRNCQTLGDDVLGSLLLFKLGWHIVGVGLDFYNNSMATPTYEAFLIICWKIN